MNLEQIRINIEPASQRYPVRVSTYAELEDGREVEVFASAVIDYAGYRSFVDDVEIQRVIDVQNDEEIELTDLDEDDELTLIDAVESVALELDPS